MHIDRRTVICVVSDAPEPIRRSVQDLTRDMNAVFGVTPRVVHEPQAGLSMIVIGPACSNSTQRTSGKPESFALRAEGRRRAGGPSRDIDIVLTGGDLRGVMYAIYTFSEKVLGVDPMSYWTDNQPKHRESIELPADYAYTDPGPLFRFRGFFINDEDLLTGWAPGKPEEHSGISLEVWDHIFETVLRLKGNMVVPGTWIFPDDGQVKLVGERGLWLSQHHATPLGVNVARWPVGVPYDYSAHPDILQKAWHNAVNAYDPNQDILWEVGLRGLSDQPYTALDATVRNNPALLGKRISDAIAEQEKIVREHHPNAVFITDLWMEGNQLMREGLLKIPAGTVTVWSDSGYGNLQDDNHASAGQGAYFHIAMMNYQANQLSEMVPVDRLLAEGTRAAKAGATQFYLVNTSDLRPVAMSARATMDAAWGNLKEGQSKSYYRDWARIEFGEGVADHVAELYQQYFSAPAHQENGWEYGDQYYHTTARRMLLSSQLEWPTYVLPGQAPIWQGASDLQGLGDRQTWLHDALSREKRACDESLKRWRAVYTEAQRIQPLVDPARRAFYQSSILTMIEINLESTQMLLDVTNAIDAHDHHREQDAIASIRDAEAALSRARDGEGKAEYGRWKNWYHGDWLTGIPRTQAALKEYEDFLADSSAPVPAPIRWADWEAYFHILHYEGDRTVNVK